MYPASQSDRRALIAKIQIAKKQLKLVDDSYRAMLVRVTGKSSSTECTDAQLVLVLEEFKRLGFSGPKKLSGKPYVRMIYAIWKDLKPYLDAPNDAALAAFVKRQTGIDKPEWLDGKAANAVTEALKAWLARERGKAAKS
jgi:phage gp16-like protein